MGALMRILVAGLFLTATLAMGCSAEAGEKSPRATPVEKACVKVTITAGGGRLVNSCGECRVAMFSPYSEKPVEFKIDAYGYYDLGALAGSLTGDRACDK